MKKLIAMLVLSLGLANVAVAADAVTQSNADMQKINIEKEGQIRKVVNWMKQHPKAAAMFLTTMTAGTVGGIWFVGFQDKKAGELCGQAQKKVEGYWVSTKDKSKQAWAWTTDNKKKVIAGSAGVILTTAALYDYFGREENKSLLKNMFKAIEAAEKEAKN